MVVFYKKIFFYIFTAFVNLVLLCCLDVNDAKTFKNLEVWCDEFVIQTNSEPEDFPFAAIGNKIDEDERKISTKQAQQWCNVHYNIPYFETSAKTGTNVREVFETITKKALEQDSVHLNMADDEFGELKEPITTSSMENNNCETALSIKLKNLDIESEEDVATGCVHYKRRAKFVKSKSYHRLGIILRNLYIHDWVLRQNVEK